ncbi:MAG: hypothetical protein NWF04_10750 [Candidatus Bathyarchaeota archaeon]|nr:hypothetical protein [Candidatus Bathyarchaeota archaeon]
MGETYFIRSNSNAAVLIILKEINPNETHIEIISCAGAAGTWEISWGAHKSYTHRIKNSLQNSGLKTQTIKEISDYEQTA